MVLMTITNDLWGRVRVGINFPVKVGMGDGMTVTSGGWRPWVGGFFLFN